MHPPQSKHFRIIPLLLFFPVCSSMAFPQERSYRLAALFADTIVLPQQRDVLIWGKGIPGTSITIKAPWGKERQTVVRPDSSWSAVLKTIKAGGRHQTSITHGDSTADIAAFRRDGVLLRQASPHILESPRRARPRELGRNADRILDECWNTLESRAV